MGMRVEAVWKPREEWGTTHREHQPLRADRGAGRDYETYKHHLEEARHDETSPSSGSPSDTWRSSTGRTTCVELLVPLFAECYEQTGLDQARHRLLVLGLSRLPRRRGRSRSSRRSTRSGVIPPVNESHVEMDAAWALYEAWVKIQTGEVDTALVYGFGKSSAGVLRRRSRCSSTPTR